MAVSISELIAKKDDLRAKRKALYDLETSLGTFTVRAPGKSLMLEAWDLEEGGDGYLIINCVVEPDLNDIPLLKAYGSMEPMEIVDKLFPYGEQKAISSAITKLAGFTKDACATKLHEELKN